MPNQKLRKVAIVGSRSVGKSSLTVQYVDGHFVESYYPTIENTFSKTIKYKGIEYATEIIDTAGQVLEQLPPSTSAPGARSAASLKSTSSSSGAGSPHSKEADAQYTIKDEYSLLNSKHFIGIHGYLLVYSVASKQSFEMVRVIRDKILNHLGVDWVPIMIVGNKSDLRPEQRQVQPEMGKKLAEEFKCSFTEASARYNENVSKAFEGMVAEIEKTQNPSEPTGGNKCVLM